MRCQAGYYAANGVCFRLNIGCIRMDNQGTCIACSNDFRLIGALCKDIIPGCNIYNHITFLCQNCHSGYYLNAANRCSQLPSGCLRFDTQQFRCAQCQPSYFLIPERYLCVRIIDQCSIYNQVDPSRCDSCAPGFILTQSNTCTAQ